MVNGLEWWWKVSGRCDRVVLVRLIQSALFAWCSRLYISGSAYRQSRPIGESESKRGKDKIYERRVKEERKGRDEGSIGKQADDEGGSVRYQGLVVTTVIL